MFKKKLECSLCGGMVIDAAVFEIQLPCESSVQFDVQLRVLARHDEVAFEQVLVEAVAAGAK